MTVAPSMSSRLRGGAEGGGIGGKWREVLVEPRSGSIETICRTRVASPPSSSSSSSASSEPDSSITSKGVTDSPNSVWTRCRASAKEWAEGKREPGFLARAVDSTSSREAGMSARFRGGSGALAIREISSFCELSAPGRTNGDRPASSVYSVAPRDHTSMAKPSGLPPAKASGADHGMDMPASSSSMSVVPEMPKSVSAGRL